MENSECFICKKHHGELENTIPIYEDDLFFINHLIPGDCAVYLGHIFIEIKRHVTSLSLLSNEETSQLGVLLRNTGKILMDSYDAEHVYSFVLGDGVPHFHMHVIPRYKNAPEEYWGTKADEWPDAPHGNFEEVNQFCKDFHLRLCDLY